MSIDFCNVGEIRGVSRSRAAEDKPHEQRLGTQGRRVATAGQMTTKGAPELATAKRPTIYHCDTAAVWRDIDEDGVERRRMVLECNPEDPEGGKLFLA